MIPILKQALAVAGLALAFGTTSAAEQALVAQRSELVFTSRQMGVPMQGRFGRYNAQVAFDPAKPQSSRILLTIDMASATLGIGEVDSQLGTSDWFDVAHHPTARFESSSVKALDPQRFEVRGRLSIKGRTREVAVPVAYSVVGEVGRATGTLPIRRLDYGIGDGAWKDTSMVADEVQIRFDLVFNTLRAPRR